MIREATRSEKERAALLAVWRSAVEATHSFLSATDIEALVPEVLAGLAGIEQLVVWAEGPKAAPLGFAGVQEGKLEMLFVHAAARGRGVGKALVLYAVETLGARELDVNEQNPQAIGFYEKLGFVQVGRSELDGQGRPYPLMHMRYGG